MRPERASLKSGEIVSTSKSICGFSVAPILGLLALSGCGDPCLDDGLGFGVCRPTDSLGGAETETGGEDETDEADTETEIDTETGMSGLWCRDEDGDGFGNSEDCQEAEMAPEGFVDDDSDCDDSDAATFPGAAQIEDEAQCMTDADDDGWGDSMPVSAGAAPGTDCADADSDTFPGAAQLESENACMTDADGDGYGDASPFGDAEPGSDCDDLGAQTFPGAAELDDPEACMQDEDQDGWGNDEPGNPEVAAGTDCNDMDEGTFVGAAPNDDPDQCMQDQDGDDFGDSDPDDPNTYPGSDCDDADGGVLGGCGPTNWCPDDDEDGFGWAPGCIDTEDPPDGYVPNGEDCDDGDADTYPGAAPNDDLQACMNDDDDDGWGDDDDALPPEVVPGTDCDDDSVNTFPGAAELDDPVACMSDEDDDGLGSAAPGEGVVAGTDCNDFDFEIGVDCGCAPVYVSCDGTAGNPTTDAFHAIGVGCSDDSNEAIVVDGTDFQVSDAGSWAVLAQFGDADDPDNPGLKIWSPRPDQGNPDAPHNAGNNMLLLTTGVVPAPDGDGVLILGQDQAGNGANGNPDNMEFPAPITAADGSNNGMGGTPFMNCDGMGDCADSLSGLVIASLNDGMWMSFTATVPNSTTGYQFDFAYLSSEYPDYVNTQFNDSFVTWVTSEDYTGNVAITPGGAPFTVTELFEDGSFDILENDPLLSGTGYEAHGATSWKTVRGAVNPGETIQLTFFLADVADAGFATQVLIDNFRWDCDGCELGVDCGLSDL